MLDIANYLWQEKHTVTVIPYVIKSDEIKLSVENRTGILHAP
jgi:hypothetical protein